MQLTPDEEDLLASCQYLTYDEALCICDFAMERGELMFKRSDDYDECRRCFHGYIATLLYDGYDNSLMLELYGSLNEYEYGMADTVTVQHQFLDELAYTPSNIIKQIRDFDNELAEMYEAIESRRDELSEQRALIYGEGW